MWIQVYSYSQDYVEKILYNYNYGYPYSRIWGLVHPFSMDVVTIEVDVSIIKMDVISVYEMDLSS